MCLAGGQGYFLDRLVRVRVRVRLGWVTPLDRLVRVRVRVRLG